MIRLNPTTAAVRYGGVLAMLLLLSAARGGAIHDEAIREEAEAPPSPPRTGGLRLAIPGTVSASPSSEQAHDPSHIPVQGFQSLVDMVLSMQRSVDHLEGINGALTKRIEDLENKLRAVHDGEEHELDGEDPVRTRPERRRDLQSGVTLRAFNQLKSSVTELKNRLACVSTSSNRDSFILEGCNAHLRNGLGDTASNNGKGNLIVGYNALGPVPPVERVRTGSHNVVVGDAHSWTRDSGILVGFNHRSTATITALVGGERNSATGVGSVVVGGQGNTNEGIESVIVGGFSNGVAETSLHGVVAGGLQNTVGESYGLVAGGQSNLVEDSPSGGYSTVVGGFSNVVTNSGNTIVGGSRNQLTTTDVAYAVSVGGGQNSNAGIGSNDVSMAGFRFTDLSP